MVEVLALVEVLAAIEALPLIAAALTEALAMYGWVCDLILDLRPVSPRPLTPPLPQCLHTLPLTKLLSTSWVEALALYR